MFEFPEQINIPPRRVGGCGNGLGSCRISSAFSMPLGFVILKFMIWVEDFFLWLPWPVMVVGVGLLAWRVMGRWWMGLLMSAMIFLIGTFGQWDLAMMTLSLVVAAVIISLAIGIPLGIAMASSDTFEQIIKPLLDGMQTMPSFVYLIPRPDAVRPWKGSGAVCHHHLRGAAGDSA